MWRFATAFGQALDIVRQAKQAIVEGMSDAHASIYKHRLSLLGLTVTGHAAEQLDALNREYEKREQVNVTAESLYNQCDMVQYSVNASPPSHSVPPLVFESEDGTSSTTGPGTPLVVSIDMPHGEEEEEL
ncbi:hypothetical protein BC629DRAFT_1446965 [Irpex lacteus]|nr:hypothetical protein BC629DRAFT_1446965 [Irpex lacteus]